MLFFIHFAKYCISATSSHYAICFQSVREISMCIRIFSLLNSQDCFKFRSDFYTRKSFLGKWFTSSLSFTGNLRQSSVPTPRNNDDLCHFDLAFTHPVSFPPHTHAFRPSPRYSFKSYAGNLTHVTRETSQYIRYNIYSLSARSDIYVAVSTM